MSIGKIFKYIGVLFALYVVFSFALVGVNYFFSPHVSYFNESNYGNHSNYTYNHDYDDDYDDYKVVRPHYTSSLGEDDIEWWFEEYGDYYNSAEAEEMGYYDDEDYLD